MLSRHGMHADSSLYESIGGASGVESLVLDFYARVFEDPVLAPFFKDTSFARLYSMQKEFFSMALGGPVEYSGETLSKVHHGRGINAWHLGRFTSHLLDTLRAKGVGEPDAQAVVDRINAFANEITGTSY